MTCLRALVTRRRTVIRLTRAMYFTLSAFRALRAGVAGYAGTVVKEAVEGYLNEKASNYCDASCHEKVDWSELNGVEQYQ